MFVESLKNNKINKTCTIKFTLFWGIYFTVRCVLKGRYRTLICTHSHRWSMQLHMMDTTQTRIWFCARIQYISVCLWWGVQLIDTWRQIPNDVIRYVPRYHSHLICQISVNTKYKLQFYHLFYYRVLYYTSHLKNN